MCLQFVGLKGVTAVFTRASKGRHYVARCLRVAHRARVAIAALAVKGVHAGVDA